MQEPGAVRSVVSETIDRRKDVLRVGERPQPEPRPTQVLVSMVLSPIHNHDLMTVAGSSGLRRANLPFRREAPCPTCPRTCYSSRCFSHFRSPLVPT